MKNKIGRIEVITGSMFSGKSEELIRRLKRAKIAKQKVQVFKPSIDYRYSIVEVVSHTGEKIEAIPIGSATELFEKVDGDTDVVGVDEAQFFGDDIIDTLKQLINRGKRVVVAGLDMDFRGEPFGPMPRIMAIADDILKLHAICTVCGEDAMLTQRLINGEPASYNDPIVLIGASETYEARCRLHHYVKGGKDDRQA